MLGVVAFLAAQQGRNLTVANLPHRIETVTDAVSAEALAADVRRWFGKSIATGDATKSEGTSVVFAVESEARPVFRRTDSGPRGDWPGVRIGQTNVWVALANLQDGDGFHYVVETGTKEVGKGFVDVYIPEPETRIDASVPKGTVLSMPRHTSAIFKGATRDWWLYVPAGLGTQEDAALLVLQDGQGPKDWAIPVLDRLIAEGAMPKTVAVFLNPGTRPDGSSDRSAEYDTLSDAYVRFLDEEILPEVEKRVRLSHDPRKRAIAGGSSGGICAFTAAWERPQSFGKVLSWIGSFTNIAHGPTEREGGHNYPFLIRRLAAKPIRVYLEDGRNDLDNQFGNWPLANQSMAAALKFKDYDFRFDFANNAHSDHYVRAHLPSILRWLWRP